MREGFRGVQVITLRLVVNVATRDEAIHRALSHFPPRQWPKGTVEVVPGRPPQRRRKLGRGKS